MRHGSSDSTLRQRACPPAMGGSENGRRGFSVIDLLVSIAVMGLLITILLPSLTSANEMARRAKCASNIRQLGLGVQMYAYDHSDLVPQSRFNTLTGDGRGAESAETIFLRLGAGRASVSSCSGSVLTARQE